MKKGEMDEIGVVGGLIVVLLTLFFLLGFFIQTKEVSNALSNKKLVNLWVIEKGKMQETVKGLEDSGRPPIGRLVDESVLISSQDELNNGVKLLMADAMVDCWDAFAGGKINFLGKLPRNKLFCFPCTTFSFSEKLKRDKKNKIRGFNSYLRENKYRAGKDQPTYFEILSSVNPEFQKVLPSPEEDVINVDKDLHVFFYAGSNTLWGKVLVASASASVIGATAGTFIAPVFGTAGGGVVGAVAGGVGGLTGAFFTSDQEYTPLVILGDADRIYTMCDTEISFDEKQELISKAKSASKSSAV